MQGLRRKANSSRRLGRNICESQRKRQFELPRDADLQGKTEFGFVTLVSLFSKRL